MQKTHDNKEKKGVHFGDVQVRPINSRGEQIAHDVFMSIGSWERHRDHRGRTEPNDIAPAIVSRLLNPHAEESETQILMGAVSQEQYAMRHAVLISNWHVKSDGCVWQGRTEHSSPVLDVRGRFFKTKSKSWYILGEVNQEISEICALIGHAIDPDAPLRNIAALLYAEKLVFGTAHEHVLRCLTALRDLDRELASPQITSSCMRGIKQQLMQMGIVSLETREQRDAQAKKNQMQKNR
jgi:hypothetical protein